MAIPNDTEFTAINLGGALGVDITQNVNDSGATWTAWYYFDANQTGEVGLWGFGDLVGYKPTVFVWTGTPGSLVGWPDPNIVFIQNKPIQFPVLNGTRYYLQFIKNGNFGTADLRIRAEYFVPSLAPAGSIFINDDTEGYPGAILSATADNTPLRFIYPFVAGEAGDVLASTGRLLYSDEFVDFNLKLYGNDFVFITDVPFTWNGTPRIRSCQGASVFYVGDSGGGGNNAIVRTVSNAGALGGTIYNLGAAGLTALAAKNDQTILYYSGRLGSQNSEIRRWDLSLNVPMSDLVADVGGTYVVFDILYLADDTIIVGYFEQASRDIFVRRYNLAGATLNTYSLGTNFTVLLPRLFYAIDDPVSFWAFLHPTGANLGSSNFKNIVCATGAIAVDRLSVEYEVGAYSPNETVTPIARFGNSASCPAVVIRSAIGTPTTGTIIINKITNPSASAVVFTFNAGGGLSPNTFTLTDGQTQTYNNVPAGIYSIEEIIPPGWSVQYSVSDGSPVSALNLAAGEVIVINVTNTQTPNQRSGIYKIVPGKRNDTLWNDLNAETTTDVKIPNPRIRTGLFGE